MADWIQISHVEFGYDQRALIADLSLALHRERCLCVLGPSGVGKSTLVGLLAGHLKPRGGTIEICGMPVTAPSAARPVVFQDDCLFPWMSALDNVAFGLRAAGWNKPKRHAHAAAMLQRFGLADAASQFPRELSGGMRQRVGLARALAIQPPCVLLDEPLNAVDLVTKSALVEDVRRYLREGGRCVFVTHEPREAAELSDAALILQFGGESVLLTRDDDQDGIWLRRIEAALQ